MEDNTSPGNQQLVISNPNQLAGLLNKSTRRETLAMVRTNPAGALAVLAQMNRDQERTPRERGFLFDDVLGEIARPEDARKLVSQHLTRTAVAEMLAQRAGLPSVASEVLGRKTIIAALLLDVSNFTPPPPLVGLSSEETGEKGWGGEDEGEEHEDEEKGSEEGSGETGQMEQRDYSAEHVAAVLYAWAPGLRDRKDWRRILAHKIGEYCLRDYLIAAVYHAQDQLNPRYIRSSEWSDVGLNPRRAREKLRFLVERNSLPDLNPNAMREAADALLQRQNEMKSALKAATKDAAKGIDF